MKHQKSNDKFSINFEQWNTLLIINAVQSLNSPFIPPHIGAQPGRARESRITCMRMLRTNQSKITRPNYTARVNVSRNAFFSSRSKKNFLWRWYCGKKHKNVKIGMWFIVVCTLIDNKYASFFFSQTFFRIVSACCASFQKFLKGKCDAYKQLICTMRRVHFEVRV